MNGGDETSDLALNLRDCVPRGTSLIGLLFIMNGGQQGQNGGLRGLAVLLAPAAGPHILHRRLRWGPQVRNHSESPEVQDVSDSYSWSSSDCTSPERNLGEFHWQPTGTMFLLDAGVLIREQDYTCSFFRCPGTKRSIGPEASSIDEHDHILICGHFHVKPSSGSGAASTDGTSLGAERTVGTGSGAESMVGSSSGAESTVGTSSGAESMVGTSSGPESMVGSGLGAEYTVGTSAGADSSVGTVEGER